MDPEKDHWKEDTFRERGPIPIKRFINDYLPKPEADLPEDLDFLSYDIEQWTGPLHEYITQTLAESPVLKGYHVYDNTSGLNSPGRPDILLYSKKLPANPTSWKHLEMGIKVVPVESTSQSNMGKWALELDPFLDDCTKHAKFDIAEENRGDNKESTRLLNSLIAFAGNQLLVQHRTFIFSVVIRGQNVRLMRWDRLGVVFSDDINLRLHSKLLSEFFWRYCQAGEEDRGWDTSVSLATRFEEALLKRVIERHLKEMSLGKRNQLFNLDRSLSKEDPTTSYQFVDFPTFKVKVGKVNYLIRAPFTDNRPWECATRGYYGVDVKKPNDLVFLKDSWRPPGYDSEADVLKEWREHGIQDHPCLPRLWRAQDVLYEDSDYPHETCTQKTKKGGPEQNDDNEPFIHHYVVGEVLFPLKLVPSSRDVARAVRDAMAGLVEVFTLTGRVHADFSPSNVMVRVSGGGEINGVLNDWDKTARRGQQVNYCTQATASMNTALSFEKNSFHIPTIMDDLESSFWTLLYTLSRQHKHEGAIQEDIFGFKTNNARLQKMAFLKNTNGLGIRFQSTPVNTLLKELKEFWAKNSTACSGSLSTKQEEPKDLLTLTDATVKQLMDIFDKTLSMEGWIPYDRRDSIYDKFIMSKRARQGHETRIKQQETSSRFPVAPDVDRDQDELPRLVGSIPDRVLNSLQACNGSRSAGCGASQAPSRSVALEPERSHAIKREESVEPITPFIPSGGNGEGATRNPNAGATLPRPPEHTTSNGELHNADATEGKAQSPQKPKNRRKKTADGRRAAEKPEVNNHAMKRHRDADSKVEASDMEEDFVKRASKRRRITKASGTENVF
ncbi:hypothetical protein C8Q75DRAFT_732285 [Abortiporus biennis]|nr:hypothetical protein C8Q75DRAFT_732285 [Abortiporus biennis]